MRRRITSSSVLATVVALLLFGLPLAFAAASITRTDERGELERLALRAASGIDPGLGRSDPLELPSTEAGLTLGVYDVTGRRVRGDGPDSPDAAVATALSGATSDGAVIADQTVVAVPVRSGESVIAAVRAASPASVVSTRIWLIWLGMSALALLAVGCAAAIARVQARRLAGPLERIGDIAVTLGRGDLAARAGLTGVREIDAVAVALNDSADRLVAMLEHERSFAADASHQLRTPLTGMRWTLESALADPDGDLRAAAATAISTADAMERAVTDLLTLATQSGPRPRTDLLPLVEELVARWRGPLAGAGRLLQLRLGDRAPDVAAAPAAIGNVLEILLDNAHRHGSGTVRIQVREASSAVAIDVVDEGHPGLDAARIFQPGDTGSPGHGLGLALARRLAEAEGGRLVLSSASGPTTFTLLLPDAEAGQQPDR